MNIQSAGTFWVDPNRTFGGIQNQALLEGAATTTRWPFTFVGWDSAWYLSIMTKGYTVSNQSYTFSPGLPFFGGLLNTLYQSPTVSLVLVALIFGLLWIPLFQLFAENYMSKRAALLSTMLLAFSPYMFVFTTVAYSEGLMLFFVLLSWILLKREKTFEASLVAAVAPLMRTMGILAMVPLFYSSLKQKIHRTRNVLLSLLPLMSLSVWFAGLGLVTGDFLAPVHTSEWSQMYSLGTLLLKGIPQHGIEVVGQGVYLQSPVVTNWTLPFAIIASFILPLFMLVLAWKKDKSLWLYGAAGYLGIVLFGSIASAPRFFSVLFPLWIPLASVLLPENKKSVLATAVLSAVLFVVSVYLWFEFLKGEFIA